MRRISPPPSRVTPQLLLWDALRPFSQTLSTAATALAFIVKRMVAFVIIVLQGQEELVRQGILAGTFMVGFLSLRLNPICALPSLQCSYLCAGGCFVRVAAPLRPGSAWAS